MLSCVTVLAVTDVAKAVLKPPIAKLADVFGRLEAFSLSIILYMLGYIQMAASKNVQTFASAQIFYSAGSTGLQVLQQIFVADTTDLLNRALFSSIPETPFLVTTWAGPSISGSIVSHSSWRWGYGLWAIVLPIAFIPLAISLAYNKLRAAKLGHISKSKPEGEPWAVFLKRLWFDLDTFGLILLCAAVTLITLPLTLAPLAKSGWHNGSMIAMIVVGGICLIAFPFWERSKRLAPRAFFPKELFKQRTVLAGVVIAFFYYMAFYLSVQPYFLTWLLVVRNMGITAAGHVTQTFSFTSTVTAVVIGVIIKYTKHYKYFVTLGACIYLLGIGLMIKYRAPNTSTATLVGCQIAVGIGGGLVNVPTLLGVQASANHQQVAAATAVFLTILEVGGAVGSGISGAVWSSTIESKLQQYLPSDLQGQASTIAGSYLTATTYPIGSPARDAIIRAYNETMQILLIIAVCMCVPLIPLSLLLKNYKLDKVSIIPFLLL